MVTNLMLFWTSTQTIKSNIIEISELLTHVNDFFFSPVSQNSVMHNL